MSVLRRHLGAFGLLVLLSQFAMQAAAQAALCCRPLANAPTAAADCCPAGSHPGKVCPVHAAKRATAPTDATCRMVCTRETEAGTRIAKTSCLSVGEREEMARTAQRGTQSMQNNVCTPGPGNACSK